MELNRIEPQSSFEKMTEQKANKKDNNNKFYKNLWDTMGERPEAQPDENKNNTVRNMDITSYYQYSNRTANTVHPKESAGVNPVKECAVKNITYADSDKIKVCIAEGCVYKAQVNREEELVYVEQKNENGSVQGYEIEPLKIKKDSDNPVEQMAMESWDK